jgi:hypothetical protein
MVNAHRRHAFRAEKRQKSQGEGVCKAVTPMRRRRDHRILDVYPGIDPGGITAAPQGACYGTGSGTVEGWTRDKPMRRTGAKAEDATSPSPAMRGPEPKNAVMVRRKACASPTASRKSGRLTRRASAFRRRTLRRSFARRGTLVAPFGAPSPRFCEGPLEDGRTNLGFTRDWPIMIPRSAKADLGAPAQKYGVRSFAPPVELANSMR